VVVLLAVGAACSGDDGDAGAQTPAPGSTGESRGATTTGPPGEPPGTAIPEGLECEGLQVLLKLDVTAEERDAVEATIRSIAAVASHQFIDPPNDSESPLFLVMPSSPGDAGAIGDHFVDEPAVVSVVFPQQVC
jgi:hypothetical protein